MALTHDSLWHIAQHFDPDSDQRALLAASQVCRLWRDVFGPRVDLEAIARQRAASRSFVELTRNAAIDRYLSYF